MRKINFSKALAKPKRIWIIGALLLALANIAYFIPGFIGIVITLCVFLTLPGYLLLNLFNIKLSSRWETLGFSLGLSLLLLMLGGLVLNGTHGLGIAQPLNAFNIFATLDIITLFLLMLNRNKIILLPAKLPTFNATTAAMFMTLTLLPLIAVGGAIRLNNGASDILTMFVFATVAIQFMILILKKKLQPLYPYAAIMMGMAVLFTTSIRSSFITGHDIQPEYYVFQLANHARFWNIGAYQNPYNACLSITILPTIMAKITAISQPYIYKVVFQMIFAVGIMPLYFFVKRLAGARRALVGMLIFISFPIFLNDMPFLNRQEIAFVFFGLLMLTSLLRIKRRSKTALTILMLLGILLSHYSSCYVTLGLIIFAYGIYKLLLHSNRQKINMASTFKVPLLGLPVIFVALLATFLWNSQITATSNGLRSTISGSIHGLLDHSSSGHSEAVSYSLFSPHVPSPEVLLANKAGDRADNVEYAPQPNIPPTKIGVNISHVINVATLNSALRALSAKIFQILSVIGLTVLLVRYKKNGSKRDAYFLALVISSFILLGLQTVLPQLSVDYGTLRFFQQMLIIAALPIVISAEFILKFLPRGKRIIMPLFFALLFLDLSGFIPQALGDYPPQLALNNSGAYYESYYITSADNHTVQWMIHSLPSYSTVEMDGIAEGRFTNAGYYSLTLESILENSNGEYLFEDYANAKTGAFQSTISGDNIRFKLKDNITASRDVIYNNAGGKVFK